ncbi:MAG: alpha-galactosidase [Candidatus Omnitrophica bacterium]|nr:alpha-galactosidase [Candidatus Omnitrophota bacterium]
MNAPIASKCVPSSRVDRIPFFHFLVALLLAIQAPSAQSITATADEMTEARGWVDAKFKGLVPSTEGRAGLQVLANLGPVQKNTRDGAPLVIAGVQYRRGLFCHANSKIIVHLPGPGKSFAAIAGVDSRASGSSSVIFSVKVADKVAFRSPVLHCGEAGVPVDIKLDGAREFIIEIGDAGDGISFDQSTWAEAKATLTNGREVWLGDLPFWQPGYTTNPQFSFSYDARPFLEVMKDWKVERTASRLDDQRTRHMVVYTDPKTGLSVRSAGIEYDDFPAVEWTVYLKNTGTVDTPIISNLEALDMSLERSSPPEFILHYYVGGESGPQDFQPLEAKMEPNFEKRFTTWFGFPTASNLPFFNIQSKDSGLIFGLGWVGAWAAQFTRDNSLGLRITAGQELTHFKLHPGEEARTPLVVLLFWKGDQNRSQNLWRRWMMAHNMPRPGGKLPAPMFSGTFPSLEGSNEKDVLDFMHRYLDQGLKPDYWWIDAGWYPNKGNNWQDLLGTWEVDTNRFPHGLRGVFDYAHSKGIKSIVWFEPERVQPDSWLGRTHPEWLLGSPGQTRIFNHGHPDAHEWLVNHIDKLITEQGIDLYRQDYACFARDVWRANDAPDRQGLTENRYVVGYLAYLDELLRRHPNLLIDICAAGGKRLELENLRRAVPLWRSDYAYEPDGMQCQTYGLAFWIPFFGTGLTASDAYQFRSQMCPSIVGNWDLRHANLDYPAVRRWLAQWRELAPNYYGDYYPMTPYRLDKDIWIAWQFDRPETGDGVVQAFRREASPFELAHLKLFALDPATTYSVTNMDTGQSSRFEGRQLLEKGLTIDIQDQPGAAVFTYHRL